RADVASSGTSVVALIGRRTNCVIAGVHRWTFRGNDGDRQRRPTVLAQEAQSQLQIRARQAARGGQGDALIVAQVVTAVGDDARAVASGSGVTEERVLESDRACAVGDAAAAVFGAGHSVASRPRRAGARSARSSPRSPLRDAVGEGAVHEQRRAITVVVNAAAAAAAAVAAIPAVAAEPGVAAHAAVASLTAADRIGVEGA